MTATDRSSDSPPPSAVQVLYDTRRGVHYKKPVLRGWLHLIWFEVSLVLGTLLLARAHGGTRIVGIAIYVASVSAMFGVSALYHRGNWTTPWSRRLQHLDQAMIFVLIAGTATPSVLVATHGISRLFFLIMIWALTFAAAAVRNAWMSAPERMVGAIFLGLGFVTGGVALPGVWIHAGSTAGALMLAGGILYTVGALSYHWRWPDPSPAVFGYHEVFHAYVCIAATCQYVAIALIIT